MPQGAPPAETHVEPIETRIVALERNFFDAHARLARSEETCANLSARCQQMSDTLLQCYQVGRPEIAVWKAFMLMDARTIAK